MIEPIEDGRKENEAKKGGGELLVASGDAAMAFDAREEVFNRMTVAVKPPIIVVGRVSARSWRNAYERAAGRQVAAKTGGIEAAVGQDPAAAQVLLQRCAGKQVMLRTSRQAESNGPANSVHDGGQLRGKSSLGLALGLIGLTSHRIGTVAMHFDVRTVDAANPAPHLPSQLGVEPSPQARCAPPAKARVYRTPRTERRRQVSPRQPGAHDIPDRRDHEPVVFARSTTSAPFCQRTLLRLLTLIFLAEPTAAPAVRNVSSSASDALRLAPFLIVPKFEDTP